MYFHSVITSLYSRGWDTFKPHNTTKKICHHMDWHNKNKINTIKTKDNKVGLKKTTNWYCKKKWSKS